MRFISTELPGVVIIEPDVHRDARGFFLESYHLKKYADAGIPSVFVQDNHSLSEKGTLRGLHAQLKSPQGKLVRVLEGEVFDVAVDIRRDSPMFGRWVGVTLSADNFRQLYIPPGFAHGFCVMSGRAQMEYKCTDFYYPEDEVVVLWSDPQIAISWPVKEPVLSARDRTGRTLTQLTSVLSPRS